MMVVMTSCTARNFGRSAERPERTARDAGQHGEQNATSAVPDREPDERSRGRPDVLAFGPMFTFARNGSATAKPANEQRRLEESLPLSMREANRSIIA
jgi:hypothetical protein